MIKVENTDVYGFQHATKAARNPMNSWNKSDSDYCGDIKDCDGCQYAEHPNICNNPIADGEDYVIGKNDLDLMQRLYKAGTEHRTYARMIYVWMDIIAPLYWWKEMDRYTVGKSQVSTSTMHKIHVKKFELDDFSHEHISNESILIEEDGQHYLNSTLDNLKDTIDVLNTYRKQYLQTKDKEDWWQLIQLLPSSYNQRRTICMSYEVIFKIIKERTGHRLDEWNEFVEILKNLPYVKEIMGIEK